MKTIKYLTSLLLLILSACVPKNNVNNEPHLQVNEVAVSDTQWTGVAVSKTNRLFVNFPTWDVNPAMKVGEVINGITRSYPNDSLNKQFICVQSVFVDQKDRLWVLDPANPHFQGVIDRGAALYCFDLSSDSLLAEYHFPNVVAGTKSYLNDIRIDVNREIGYITDSEQGGIVVINLKNGQSYRALDSDCEGVKANIPGIEFLSTGLWGNKVNSDGLELSASGDTLYFTALTGNILYKISTAELRDSALTSEERCARVIVENPKSVPADGIARLGDKIIMGDLPYESVYLYDLKSYKGNSLHLSEKIRWADSFAIATDSTIYITESQINYPLTQRTKYRLLKIKL